MAGTRVVFDSPYIELTDSGVLEALERLQALGGNMEAPFGEVGEYLLLTTEQRFDQEAGPYAIEWLDVTPATRARKKHPKILTEGGFLRGAFSYRTEPLELTFGSNVIYGAAHQYGYPEGNLPARPFLGFDDRDENEILAIFLDEIDRQAKGEA